MRPFGKDSKQVRVLFLLVDVEDPQSSLTELHKITIENEYTLILSWGYALGSLASDLVAADATNTNLARRSVEDTLRPSSRMRTGHLTC